MSKLKIMPNGDIRYMCPSCNLALEKEDFGSSSSTANKMQCYCKKCNVKKVKMYALIKPEVYDPIKKRAQDKYYITKIKEARKNNG